MPNIRTNQGIFVAAAIAAGRRLNLSSREDEPIFERAVNEEFEKISRKVEVFAENLKNSIISNVSNARNIEEVRAAFADFRQSAINLILYVINADTSDIKKFLEAKSYSGIAGKLEYFYGSNAPPCIGEWFNDETQYPPFARGLGAMNSIINALKDIEKIMDKVGKPKTFFNRSNPLSLEEAKEATNKILNNLVTANSPLVGYFKGLHKLFADVEEQRMNQMVRGASSVSSGESSHHDEEETAGSTLLPVLPAPGTATSASAVDAPRSPRVREGEVEEEKTTRERSSSGSSLRHT